MLHCGLLNLVTLMNVAVAVVVDQVIPDDTASRSDSATIAWFRRNGSLLEHVRQLFQRIEHSGRLTLQMSRAPR